MDSLKLGYLFYSFGKYAHNADYGKLRIYKGTVYENVIGDLLVKKYIILNIILHLK